MAKTYLALIPSLCLSLTLAACGSDGIPASPAVAGASGNSAGAAGQAGGANPGGAGAAGAAGAATAGAGVGGANGTAGGTPTAGSGGTPGAAGAAGGGNSAGAAGVGPGPSGPSAGCMKNPPGNDSEADFKLHEVHITEALDPVYQSPNGTIYQKQSSSSGKYDYAYRPYSVKLPKGYDPTKKYAITLGGGGCGGNAVNFAGNPGGGYQPDGTQSTIQVGLSYLAGCFDDGGSNIDFRSDSPEIPYLRAVIKDVEANYCVDQSQVFLSGTSSGGWLALTGGCALADTIRGIGVISGGLRLHRPACTGPQPSIFVEGLGDTTNPIGPIEPPNASRDSPGSGPARDEILKRNGCVSQDFKAVYDAADTSKATNAPHAAWDAAFPKCVKYTGCPANAQVVWCALDCGHQCDKEDPIKYKDAIWKFWTQQVPRP